ncbi:hypothetical protein ROHU_028163 [Labeo rohita]|uniref:Uncharacterized protein n=1 Tax=Labeo rohita TaxID=84645 RepID=A0A498L1Q8_LABRO|nr:hypothetical protein ROHU_035051 [Labeo rohita]RXN15342.1 hypothetical protein ROHU_028163 [Labeo rohita]
MRRSARGSQRCSSPRAGTGQRRTPGSGLLSPAHRVCSVPAPGASAGLFPETPDAADWMSRLNRDADPHSSRMPPSARLDTSGLEVAE